MPRYTLILSDEDYIRALRAAAKEGKTLGKWINDLIKKAIEEAEKHEQ